MRKIKASDVLSEATKYKDFPGAHSAPRPDPTVSFPVFLTEIHSPELGWHSFTIFTQRFCINCNNVVFF